MTAFSWVPILEGESAAAAREIVAAIAEELDSEPVRRLPPRRSGPWRALLYVYLAKENENGEQAAHAIEILDAATDGLANVRHAGLYGGVAGVAWLAAHLERELSALTGEEPGDDDPCSEIDPTLLTHVDIRDFRGDYDLISGLVGIGVYALERIERPSGRELAERIVRRLGELAEQTPAGTTWFTPPERLPSNQRLLAPEGYHNLGLAHGVPGVIAFLAHAHRAGIEPATTSTLLEGAFAWVIDQQLPGGPGARYPGWLPKGRAAGGAARTAWCYGGLGVASALLVAATSTGNDGWREHALRLARMEAERPYESSGVVDAGLCHGAAGNAHLYGRMFQATREPWLRDAARSWMLRAIEMRKPGSGIAGYRSWGPANPEHSQELAWLDDGSFLTGAAGIALALLAAQGTVVPRWDRLLLCDAPPGAPASP